MQYSLNGHGGQRDGALRFIEFERRFWVGGIDALLDINICDLHWQQPGKNKKSSDLSMKTTRVSRSSEGD